MKLFAKIFFGVFLGVIAALVAIKVPAKIAERQALVRELRFLSLSPVALKSKCGPPSADEFVMVNGDYLYRKMSYKSGPITFEFLNASGDLKKKPDENDSRQWSVSVKGRKWRR